MFRVSKLWGRGRPTWKVGRAQTTGLIAFFSRHPSNEDMALHVDAATGQSSASKSRKRKRGTNRATEEEQTARQEEAAVDEAPKKKVGRLLCSTVLHLELFFFAASVVNVF